MTDQRGPGFDRVMNGRIDIGSFEVQEPAPTPTPRPTPTPGASKYDFNGDGHPDCALFNASTLGTAIWYLNNNVFVSGTYAPTLPPGWSLVAF